MSPHCSIFEDCDEELKLGQNSRDCLFKDVLKRLFFCVTYTAIFLFCYAAVDSYRRTRYMMCMISLLTEKNARFR